MAKQKSKHEAGVPAKKVARAKPAAAAGDEAGAEQTERMTAAQQLAGQRLINRVRTEVIARGLPERYPADLMGITQVYWNSLSNGHRPISRVPKEKLQRLADFLKVPLIQVYILSGHFQVEDFVVMQQHEAELDMMVEQMRRHPKWMALAPTIEEWDAMPSRAKLLIASLFESVVHKSFLEHAKMEHDQVTS